jgi:hypothetical protein
MATRAARKPRERGITMMVPKAITASAARATSLPKANSSSRTPQWQMDALAYYDQIGAVRYAAQFAARTLAKLRWYPAVRDENGEVTESDDDTLTSLFERVQDPGGGRSMMFATFGQLDFLCGECYLLWSQADPEEPDSEETWEIVSTLEMRKQGKKGGQPLWHRITAPGLTPQELVEADDEDFEPVGDNVLVYRWWRRHPAYSQMADSPMRSVLAECEEIVRSTHSINARLISRLAGPGILAIPASWSLKPLQQVVGEENPEEDPFQARLTTAMITAISKPGSAESVAPIVIRVPDEQTDRAHLYKIWEPSEVIRELELREKALQRFAVGVDMPPEKVMGLSTSGTQHWNAWMVDEDAWAHIDPVAQALADNLASSYLRPAAKDEGFADWQSVTVGYDPAAVLANPDGFADALKMYEARAVGKAYLRAAGNAQDKDAMTDEELEESLFVATHIQVDVSNGAMGEPQARPTITPVPATEQQPPTPNGRPPTGEDTPRAAPAPPDGMNASAYLILGAATATLEEIRSRVGTRLRNHLQGRCQECLAAVDGVRSGLVAATLGPERVLEHGPDLVGLVIDGGRNFVEAATRMGVSYTQAQALAEVLEMHAISTIYERTPDLPAGFLGRVKALSGVAA